MPRTKDLRFDFRKGLNLAYTSDVLDSYELRYARNARQGQYGGIAKRAGTKRVHGTQIGSGAAVLGLHQWAPGGTRQLVAICNTDLFYKAQADANFTTVAAGFSATVRPRFAQHIIAGTPTLFIADGTLRSYDGTSTITDISGAPTGTVFIEPYKGRMFAVGSDKTLYWSKVADPTIWSSTAGGGQAFVDIYSTDALVALARCGSSLMLFKENSIARFTGVSKDDIQIDTETEGISADIGTVAPGTVIRMEEVVFFLTDRGPYVASEAGVQAVGTKVETAFDDAEMDHLPNAVAVHHKGRREVWVFFPENEETQNTVGYCLNYRLNSWTGPWDMGDTFNVCSAAQFEKTDRVESVVLGGYDGWVRYGDETSVGAKDDVLSDGSGGTNITMEVTLPELYFGDADAVKRMVPSQLVRADLKTNGSLQAICTGDHMGSSQTATLTSRGAGVKPYRFKPGTKGRSITVNLKDATSEIVQINGARLEAEYDLRAS